MNPPPIPPKIALCQSDRLGLGFAATTPRPRGQDSRTQRNHSRAPPRRPRAKLNANWPVAWSATASAQPETSAEVAPASRTVPTARLRLERPNAITVIVRCRALGAKHEDTAAGARPAQTRWAGAHLATAALLSRADRRTPARAERSIMATRRRRDPLGISRGCL